MGPSSPQGKPHRPTGKRKLPLRSRSGCLTCRDKHLKCDETKPNCQICISRGIECGGYQRGLKWSTKHEKHAELAGHGFPLAQPQTWTPKKRRGRPPKRPLGSTSASSASSVPISHSDPGDMNRGLFPEVILQGSQAVDYSHEEQLLHGVQSTGCNDLLSQFDLSMSTADFQWDPDTFELPNDFGDVVDNSTGLSLLPIQQSAGSLYIPPTIAHIPSSLVEYWFRDVCSLWSQYDSPTNFNRTMATALWSTSEAVSTSLQSMSAAYLSSKFPHMKKTSISMMKVATTAIEAELQVVKSSHHLEVVPMGLIYGLFCIGTSICWLNATQLGIPFLREAKALLCRANLQRRSLSEEERRLLHIFNKSWNYTELLLSIVSDTNPYSSYESNYVDDISTDAYPTAKIAEPDLDDIPHPWTGVSNTVSRLLTQTMRLCRNYLYHLKHPGPLATRDHATALRLIEEAKLLEERLLGLDFESVPAKSETGDQRTPCQHLINVAEAYRLAGLIHIYQTFPDLVLLRLPSSISESGNAHIPWQECITPLSLRLANLIEQLPPDSGSKMTQPLLCITASTGLRFEPSEATFRRPPPAHGVPSSHNDGCIEDSSMSDYIGHLIQADEDIEHLTTVTESRLKIVDARCFLMNRLDILETVLPPRPIAVAKGLVQAIWSEYDNKQTDASPTHWIHIMDKNNLRSLFG
ncbi:hypothetical protein FZEAL_4833 [Fusarium zealandicum]|uniref:Zn(2)-C6 fungal-type domain-containing protein n=1 Tax=Fusarium zealandicum TaxID=1053134 RepID=A0A8H4ULF4_9HYPO|nr:hypothetical protein FZEAL_4833 [Fusarium zealandicum]